MSFGRGKELMNIIINNPEIFKRILFEYNKYNTRDLDSVCKFISYYYSIMTMNPPKSVKVDYVSTFFSLVMHYNVPWLILKLYTPSSENSLSDYIYSSGRLNQIISEASAHLHISEYLDILIKLAYQRPDLLTIQSTEIITKFLLLPIKLRPNDTPNECALAVYNFQIRSQYDLKPFIISYLSENENELDKFTKVYTNIVKHNRKVRYDTMLANQKHIGPISYEISKFL